MAKKSKKSVMMFELFELPRFQGGKMRDPGNEVSTVKKKKEKRDCKRLSIVLVTVLSVKLSSRYDFNKFIWMQFSIFSMKFLHYQDSLRSKAHWGCQKSVEVEGWEWTNSSEATKANAPLISNKNKTTKRSVNPYFLIYVWTYTFFWILRKERFSHNRKSDNI